MKSLRLKKIAAILFCVMFAVASFAGCSKREPPAPEPPASLPETASSRVPESSRIQPEQSEKALSSMPESSSKAEESSAPEESSKPETKSDKLTPDDPENFVVYRGTFSYFTSQQDDVVFVPTPMKVGNSIDADTLSGMIDDGRYGGLPIDFTLSVEGDTATIDFQGEYASDVMMASGLWATITQNCGGIKKVRFLGNGEAFSSDFYTDEDGYYLPVGVSLPSHSTEELAALRSDIPYKLDMATPFNSVYPVVNDAASRKIAEYIYAVTRFNIPKTSFSGIKDADSGFIIMAAINNTAQCYWYDGQVGEEGRTFPKLAPLTQTCDDYEGYLKEHIEKTARILFGNNANIVHSSRGIGPWKYDSYGGVYTPPHMGFYGGQVPVILEYADLDDRYEATVVFLVDGAGSWVDSEGNALNENDIAGYCENELPRHRITLMKNEDGTLRYFAHLLPRES